MTTKCSYLWFCSILALGLAAPALAGGAYPSTLNDSEQPGSVLVFPKFIRGTGNDIGVSGQTNHAVTEIEISVTCPQGAPSCGTVNLRAHWVCPGCTESSFNLKTTVGGTLYFNPEGVTVLTPVPLLPPVVTTAAFPSNVTTTIPVPPCQRGYLIVWVIDDPATGNPIKFDGLIGDAVIRAPIAGFGPTTARAYTAIPIQADPSLNTGDPTDLDVNGNHTGALVFDGSGSHYQSLTGGIFGTVRYENSVLAGTPPEGVVVTDLTLLTLDARLDLQNPVTTVGLDFYTPDEQFVDTSTRFQCWAEQELTAINASLTEQVMGRKGLVKSTFAEQQLDLFTTKGVTLLGLVETQEGYVGFGLPGRSFSYLLSNDSNPVCTAFVPEGSSPGF
jgi:hypothetical protein